MKKILGVSLIAMMAVTTARAEIASKAYVDPAADGTYVKTSYTTGRNLTELDSAVKAVSDLAGGTSVADQISAALANSGNPYQTETQVSTSITNGAVQTVVLAGGTNDGTVKLTVDGVATDNIAVTGLGSAAYTDAAAYDAAGAATAAVAALDATKSQTAGTDGLALSITQTDGVITSISGSIAAETYDAYGDAATAETNAATYTDTKIGTLGNDANSQPYANVKAYVDDKVAAASSGAAGAVAALDATESQTASASNGQLNLEVTQADGLITGISGSIAAETYDAYGAASNAVNALDGSITTVENGVVTSISQTDGVVTAGMAKIVNVNVADNAAIDMSKIAMPDTIANGTTVAYGTYALTADVTQNGITYKWEQITGRP